MSGKTQTSLWIENDLYYLVKSNDLNLTRFVNDSLRRYFSVSSVEDVKQEIDSKKQELSVLKKRLEELVAERREERTENSLQAAAWDELKKNYRDRRVISDSMEKDRLWITGPKNLERCKILGLSSDEAIEKLREWYDAEEEGNE